jgi:hypothetical protein
MDAKPGKTKAADAKDAKAERLAAALRANLARRKLQARARSADAGPDGVEKPGKDPEQE